MISVEARETLAWGAFLLLAAVAAPSTGLSAENANADRQRPILERIEGIVARSGPHSRDLIEPLSALALRYEESGEDVLAVAAVSQALQILRINRGLHSLDQAALLRQLIRIEGARGNHARAWDLEQELLTLAGRHRDDVRTAPILREIADGQMEVLRRYMAGQFPPQVILGCFYKPAPYVDGGSCTAGSRDTVIRGMLAEAQKNYAAAIAVILRNEIYASDELRELEMRLVRSSDLIRSEELAERHRLYGPLVFPLVADGLERIEPWRSRMDPLLELARWDLPDVGQASLGEFARAGRETDWVRIRDPYHRGRQSLRRLYAYDVASSRSPLSQIDRVVQMADWELLYSHHGLAVDGSELAYAMLERAGVPAPHIERIFAPDTPIVLPAYEPNPLAAVDEREATGHVDVAFEITKFGRGRKVEILDAANVTEAVKERLVVLIKNSRFRPLMRGGRVASASHVVFRHHVSE
jgi:hypothetical protein